MDKEYDHEKEQHKLRMAKWGMNTKEAYETTIDDCIGDLKKLVEIHGQKVTGVVVIPIYDHLEMQELECKYHNVNVMDKPPTFTYLCSGGVPIMEAIGSIEMAKFRIMEEN